MDGFDALMTTLAIAGGLALGVERILEVLKHVVDLDNKLLDKKVLEKADQQAVTAMAEAQQALQSVQQWDDQRPCAAHNIASQSEPVLAQVRQVRLQSQGIAADAAIEDELPAPQIPIRPISPRIKSETSQILFLQLMGAGLGIVLAQIFNVHLVASFMTPLGAESNFSSLLDIVISGIIIGGGSQPVHLLMRFMTTRKLPNIPMPRITPPIATTAVDVEWVAIPYQGGINSESLEKVHLRAKNPSLIVYHHTGMSSDSSFQDIVDEYLVRKKWLTGYHCVIMPDGQIKPFCRWDRTGNHTQGYNQHSLGLAFHGNFHTQVGSHASNADGRYGLKEPTEAQLISAARVVALWTHLYDGMDLDFEKSIVAHEKLSNNKMAGPGSNFPTEVFQNKIRHFYELWAESDQAHDCINRFRKKDFLFVDDGGE